MEENQSMGLMVLALYTLMLFAPFLLLVILLFKKNKEFHDKVLIAWLAVSVLNSFVEFIKITEPPNSIPILLDLNRIFLLSNLFFFHWYLKSLIKSEYKWCNNLVWTLLPSLLWSVACVVNWFFQQFFLKNGQSYNSLVLEYDHYIEWLEVPLIIGVIVIGIWAWSKLKEMLKYEENTSLSIHISNLRKVLLFLVSIYFIVVSWEYCLSKVLQNESIRLVCITFLLWLIVGLVIALGFYFLRQKSLYKKPKHYIYSNKAIEKLFGFIVDIMVNTKPYLNPSLTISELAVMLGETPQKVSEAIKLNTNQTFYSFINKYRVDEAKKLLQDPNYTSYTILSIGLEAGFNSKATFNRVFKNETGVTPSNYCYKVKCKERI